jgi:hypothetical protein
MSELELLIGKHYRDDDGWEVYTHHPEGGCVTLFRGTEQECEEFIRTRGPELTAAEVFGRES